MNLLSAAERLAAIDRSAIAYHPERCLYEVDRFANCSACSNSCPSGAIQPGKPLTVDAERCEACLACLVACPTGAFTSDDSVVALLSCAARLETQKIEVICKRVKQPEIGADESIHALVVRGCLAGLGSGALLALAALGFEQILVHTNVCTDCPWGQALQPIIASQVEHSVLLLSLLRSDRQIMESVEIEAGSLVQRPVWDVHNPPLSRRDLFLMATRQGQVALARAMNPQTTPGRSPGRERQRVMTALAHFGSAAAKHQTLPQELSFASVIVDDRCTACAACARICPTGALRFENLENKAYRLLFSASQCIACAACIHVCAEEAIQFDDAPPFSALFESNPLVLDEGELTRCKHCKALIASRLERSLCPICAFRAEHPFGSSLPPILQQRIAEKSRQVSQ
jgi:ferredoxin